MFLVNSMREAKEKQLERRNKEMRRSMPKGTVKPIAPVPQDDKPGGYTRAIPNIR